MASIRSWQCCMRIVPSRCRARAQVKNCYEHRVQNTLLFLSPPATSFDPPGRLLRRAQARNQLNSSFVRLFVGWVPYLQVLRTRFLRTWHLRTLQACLISQTRSAVRLGHAEPTRVTNERFHVGKRRFIRHGRFGANRSGKPYGELAAYQYIPEVQDHSTTRWTWCCSAISL